MGAAWDAMCKNEDLKSTLSKRNRTIREQKELITEFAEGIVKYLSDNFENEDISKLCKKAKNILYKQSKKKK